MNHQPADAVLMAAVLLLSAGLLRWAETQSGDCVLLLIMGLSLAWYAAVR